MADAPTLKSTGKKRPGGALKRLYAPQGVAATLRKARYIRTPDRADLPQEAEKMSDFRFPHRVERHTMTRGKGKEVKEVFGPSATAADSYGGIFYDDFLSNLTDYYFDTPGADNVFSDGAPDGYVAPEGDTLLPKQVLEEYAHGTDSPYRTLEESMESYTGEDSGLAGIQRKIEDIEGEGGLISEEEENIQLAQDLYAETEEQIAKKRGAQTLSGIEQEKQAQAAVSRSGYEMGPAGRSLGKVEDLSEEALESLYDEKVLAREGMERTVADAQSNIEGYEEDVDLLKGEGRDIYSDMQTAYADYDAYLGATGPLAQIGDDTISAAETALETVTQATKKMFSNALDRAKHKTNRFVRKKRIKFPYKAEKFEDRESVGTFQTQMYDTKQSMGNLASYLPSAEDISGDLSDIQGQYDWLLES
jgi:hypothetical protein